MSFSHRAFLSIGDQGNQLVCTRDVVCDLCGTSLGNELDEQERIVTIEDNESTCKFLTNKDMDIMVFKGVIPKIWELKGHLRKSRKTHSFTFFGNKRDKNRVTKGGPWSFDHALFMFDTQNGATHLHILTSDYAPFGFTFITLFQFAFV